MDIDSELSLNSQRHHGTWSYRSAGWIQSRCHRRVEIQTHIFQLGTAFVGQWSQIIEAKHLNHMSLSWRVVKCWGNCSHIPYSLLLGFERSARWRCASSLQVQSWQSLPLMNSKEKLQRLWSKSWPVRFLDLLIIFHFPTGKSTLLRESMKGICLCFLFFEVPG